MKLRAALHKYDASKASPETFAAHVVENLAANILAKRKAAKRDPTPTPRRSGDHQDPEDETAEVIDLSDLREAERRRRQEEELRADVARAMACLQEEQRELCRLLMDGTIADVVRDTGTKRSTLYGSIRRIRREFERAELRAYLRADTFRSVPVCPPRRKA